MDPFTRRMGTGITGGIFMQMAYRSNPNNDLPSPFQREAKWENRHIVYH